MISSGGRWRSRLDPKLIRAVAEGKAWYERIKSGEYDALIKKYDLTPVAAK